MEAEHGDVMTKEKRIEDIKKGDIFIPSDSIVLTTPDGELIKRKPGEDIKMIALEDARNIGNNLWQIISERLTS